MEHTSELLKDVADRLARFIVTADGSQVTRLLQLANLLGNPSISAPEQSLTDHIGKHDKTSYSPAESSPPPRVGIWEEKKIDGKTYFVRCKDKIDEWSLWANVTRIAPKGAKRRVLLIGESVARGYLYDPLFTMSRALEMTLQRKLGKDKVEVIDLARTNLSLDLKELAQSAILLEPDVAIIFAGNNWKPRYDQITAERMAMGAQIRKYGALGLKQGIEERLAEHVRQGVSEIASSYKAKGIPLIWIIPEFNLGDWRDPISNAPHLSQGANEKWFSHYEAAREALCNNDFKTATELAHKMVLLDSGTTAASLYILAECSQQSGDINATRHYLELARDAAIWDHSRASTPRSFTVTQETLRQEVARCGNGIVDMPKIFKGYLKGGIPDRQLFLDYCHLTTEGIQITTAAAASHVLHLFNGSIVPWRELIDESIAPTREVEAEASFLAAIHNAHWAQSYDVVHYYCLKAIRLSRSIVPVMLRFIDLQTRRTPMLMCRSAEEIAVLGSELIQHYILRHNHQLLDKCLLDAVVSSLKKLRIDAGEQLNKLRREEHSLSLRDTNLLDYYYVSSARQTQEETWLAPGAQKLNMGKNYYSAYSAESSFFFVGDAGHPVKLHLTCRLPDLERLEGTISIEVNGSQVGELNIDREWGTWDIDVAGHEISDGLNEIIIHWPVPAFPGEKLFESIIDDLMDKRLPEFFCPFGEIHSFKASNARAGVALSL
jgi:hypothetical protein